MKLRAVSRIHFIAAKGGSGRDHANRRRRRFHRADLHGRGVRPEQPAIGQIKRILFIAGRMIRRGIECVEAMPFVLDIRPFREREPHPTKNADRAVEHLGERMKRPDLVQACREGRCRSRRARSTSFAARSFSPGLRDRGRDRSPRLHSAAFRRRDALPWRALSSARPRPRCYRCARDNGRARHRAPARPKQRRFPPARRRGVRSSWWLMWNVKPSSSLNRQSDSRFRHDSRYHAAFFFLLERVLHLIDNSL